jgi:hypothetical protein
MGIVYLIQGKPKGGKMIGISIGLAVLWRLILVLVSVALQGM